MWNNGIVPRPFNPLTGTYLSETPGTAPQAPGQRLSESEAPPLPAHLNTQGRASRGNPPRPRSRRIYNSNSVPQEDKELIARQKSSMSNTYLKALRAFSGWLGVNGLGSLEARLKHPDLGKDIEAFRQYAGYDRNIAPAVGQLQRLESGKEGRARAKHEAPQPEDRKLIARQKSSMNNSYLKALRAFSGWLGVNKLGSLETRLNHSDLGKDIEVFAQQHSTGYGQCIASAVGWLQRLESGKEGRAHTKHEAPQPEDLKLIARLKSSMNNTYLLALSAFSGWLGKQRLGSLEARLKHPDLGKNIEAFRQYSAGYGRDIAPAVGRLQRLESGKAVRAPTKHEAPQPEDKELIARLNSSMSNSYLYDLRAFSGWLGKQRLGSLNARLNHPDLGKDIEAFAQQYSTGYGKDIASAVKQLRKLPPPGAHDIPGAHDEGAESSSFVIPPSDWSGWNYDLSGLNNGREANTPGQTGDEVQSGQLRKLPPPGAHDIPGAHDEGAESSSFVMPPSDWSGWNYDLSGLNDGREANTPGQTGDDVQSGPSRSDSTFNGLSPLHDLPDTDLRDIGLNQPMDVTDPYRTPERDVQFSSARAVPNFNERSPLAEADYLDSADSRSLADSLRMRAATDMRSRKRPGIDVSDYSSPSPGAEQTAKRLRAATDMRSRQKAIIDLNDYPSPPPEAEQARRVQQTEQTVQRLREPESWLWDSDILSYTTHLDQTYARRLGGRLHFVDPQQVEILAGENAMYDDIRPQVLPHLTAPHLLMPLNQVERHWSLLYVDQQQGVAFHYDSLPGSEEASVATEQFRLASRAAAALGIRNIRKMPCAPQRDGYSCGYHVLAGMEALAWRLVSRKGATLHHAELDLSGISPDQEHIRGVLLKNLQEQ